MNRSLLRLVLSAVTATTLVACGGGDDGPPRDPLSWQDTERVQPMDNTTTYSPLVAVARDGSSAMLVWAQRDDATNNSLYARRWTLAEGWGEIELIETEQAGVAFASLGAIGMDDQGRVIVVWQQNNGSARNAWANRYVPGEGWGTAELLESSTGWIYGAELALSVSPSGEAVVAWSQDLASNGTYEMQVNRYSPTDGWSGPESIESTSPSSFHPDVAITAEGGISIVWQQRAVGANRYDIWANHYVPGTGWGTAGAIESVDTGNANLPRIVIDGEGTATVAWEQYNGARYEVVAARGSVAQGFAAPVVLGATADGHHNRPRLAADGQGQVTVAWAAGTEEAGDLRAARHVDGAWSDTVILAPAVPSHWYEMNDVRAAANGDVVVGGYAWSTDTGSTQLRAWAHRYRAGFGWQEEHTLSPATSDYGVGEIRLAMDDDGRAMAVWQQGGGTGLTPQAMMQALR